MFSSPSQGRWPTSRKSVIGTTSNGGTTGRTRQSMTTRVSKRFTPARGSGIPSHVFGTTNTGSNSTSSGRMSMQPRMSTLGRDIGPLRDPSHVEMLIQEVKEYLKAHDYSQIMRIPLDDRTFRTPTQKDFTLMFQFLYNRLDPGYKFTRGIDAEVPFILKVMKCPYADSISRSSLMAIGGQWPQFLAILYWMVSLNRTLEEGCDLEQEYDQDEALLSQLTDKYAQQSYSIFLEAQKGRGNGDLSDLKQEVEQGLAAINENTQSLYEQAFNSFERKRLRLDQLQKEAESYRILETKRDVLENDLIKFQNYITNMESKKSRWDQALVDLQRNVESAQTKAEEAKAECTDLKHRIEIQGVSIHEIDALNEQRLSLERSLESVDAQRDELRSAVSSLEDETQEQFRFLDTTARAYNSLVYSVYALVSTPESEEERSSAQVRLQDPTSQQDGPIVNVDLNEVKQTLIQRKQKISRHVIDLRDKTAQLEAKLDNISESIAKSEEQEKSLASRLRFVKMNYEQVTNQIATRNQDWLAQCDHLEQQLHQIRHRNERTMVQLQQKASELEIKRDNVMRELLLAKGHMNSQLYAFADTVTTQKSHIYNQIMAYRKAVEQEQSEFEAWKRDQARAAEDP